MPFSKFKEPSAWYQSEAINSAAEHLINRFRHRYADAAMLIDSAPNEAFELIHDVEIKWETTELASVCSISGTFTDSAARPTITVFQSTSAGRNTFTVLHELGHYLISIDDEYQYQVALKLGSEAQEVEEKVVDAFAASLLIPKDLFDELLGDGVTASGIRDLIVSTNASATACAVAALNQHDDGLIMLASAAGEVFFSATTGDPLNPGRHVAQPAIQIGAQKAWEAGGHANFSGDQGLQYASGNANTNVTFDIATEGSLIIAVVTPAIRDSRISSWDKWLKTCDHCLESYSPDESEECARCQKSTVCPDCGRCTCTPVLPICSQCYMELSRSDVAERRTIHTECQD